MSSANIYYLNLIEGMRCVELDIHVIILSNKGFAIRTDHQTWVYTDGEDTVQRGDESGDEVLFGKSRTYAHCTVVWESLHGQGEGRDGESIVENTQGEVLLHTIKGRQPPIISHFKRTSRQANHPRHRGIRLHVPTDIKAREEAGIFQPAQTWGHRLHDRSGTELALLHAKPIPIQQQTSLWIKDKATVTEKKWML